MANYRYTPRVMDKADPRLEDFKLLVKAKKSQSDIRRILGISGTTSLRWAKLLNLKLSTKYKIKTPNYNTVSCNPPNNAL